MSRNVELFDDDQGNGVEAGIESLPVAVCLPSPVHTFTEAEIEPVAKKIAAAVDKQVGSVRRA